MPTFTQSTFIDAPVETVFAFHERPDALTLLCRIGHGIQPAPNSNSASAPFPA